MKKLSKEKLALEIIERLKKEYPDAGCTLDYNQAWKLLVSVRLAAQCTDARVNEVVPGLYAKFPDVNALAQAPVEEIEEIVKPCGLGHSKARDISACMKLLKEKYDGKVPEDFDALMELPGVGRKSANLIMGDVFGKPAIVTDTHCIRLVNRMGLVDGIKEPAKEGGDGAVEDHSSAGGKRFLPQAGVSRKRSVHGEDKALLRQMLPEGYLRKGRSGIKRSPARGREV